jgi:hypothetical protein
MRQGTDTNWNWFNHLCSTHRTEWDNAKQNYGG